MSPWFWRIMSLLKRSAWSSIGEHAAVGGIPECQTPAKRDQLAAERLIGQVLSHLCCQFWHEALDLDEPRVRNLGGRPVLEPASSLPFGKTLPVLQEGDGIPPGVVVDQLCTDLAKRDTVLNREALPGVREASYRGPPAAVAEMCAATPTLTDFEGFSCGPLVSWQQPGLEQRCPTRMARVSLVEAEKSSRF